MSRGDDKEPAGTYHLLVALLDVIVGRPFRDAEQRTASINVRT
jgi:hypothetical protein